MPRAGVIDRRALGSNVRVPEIGGGAAAFTGTPDTILVTMLQWVRADLGVTIDTGVSVWADQSGNGADYAQATGTAQPAVTVADVSLNGQDTITFDGTSDFLAATLALPAPGTTPTFIWAILRQNAWTITRNIFSDTTATRLLIFQQTAEPGITMASTTQVNNNTAVAVGAWCRLACQFQNSTSDYLKLAATSVTGASANNFAGGGGRRIAINSTGSAFCSMSLAELIYFAGVPTAGQLADMDLYATARYGAGLV